MTNKEIIWFRNFNWSFRIAKYYEKTSRSKNESFSKYLKETPLKFAALKLINDPALSDEENLDLVWIENWVLVEMEDGLD